MSARSSRDSMNMEETETPLVVHGVNQQGGLLQAKLTIDLRAVINNQVKRFFSPIFVIQGTNLVQIQILAEKTRPTAALTGAHFEFNFTFYLKILKVEKLSGLKTKIFFSCKELGITDKSVQSEEGVHQIHEMKTCTVSSNAFNVILKTVMIDPSGTFESIYDDIDLIDFELHGEDGSVPVHKAVLASCSPVFKRMFSGDWKETNSGNINIPETTKATLENFKRYLYLREMPKSGCLQLLLLATYYLMPGLEQKCIDNLVSKLTPQNTLHLCEFAVKNQMTKLHLAILEKVQSGAVKVSDIYISTTMKRSKSSDDEEDENGGPSSKQIKGSDPVNSSIPGL